MAINRIMDIAKGSLSASQTALATTSHNVSNANTRGYSKQRVDLQTADPADYGRNRVGRGVVIGNIERAHSDFVQSRLNEESSGFGKFDGMSSVYQQLDDMFHGDADTGISAGVTQFFNDVRTLSTQPDSIALRQSVTESAQNLGRRFERITGGVEAMVNDLDHRIDGSVSDINNLTTKIASLNQRIMQTEAGGAHANDERDSRDLAMQDLAKQINFTSFSDNNGMVTIQSDKLGVLVSGSEPSMMAIEQGAAAKGSGGYVGVVMKNNYGETVRNVTGMINSGALGGYLEVRDQVIPKLRDQLDNLAHGIVQNVNNVHREAYGRDGVKGRDFFVDNGSPNGAAASLKVNEEILRDPSRMGVADRPNAAGDNAALLRITDLQDQKIFNNGASTLNETTAGIVGTVGHEVHLANENLESQRGLMTQIENYREQAAGVSLDEEAIDMVKFQKAFDASARMIQVADSMLETVINLRRM